MLREGDPSDRAREIAHVVVLTSLDAPRRGARRAGGRTRPVEAQPNPAPVTSGRATVISIRDPFADEVDARAWLKRAGEPELAEGLTVLARLLHAHHIASADPWPAPPSRERVIAARIGFGTGDEVADGRWTAARELTEPSGPARGSRRRRGLGGSEARLAALLAGTQQPLAAEELVLRARSDVEGGRPREAALQLLVALDAMIAELTAGRPSPALAQRISTLRERRASTAAAAQTALTAVPTGDAQQQIVETLDMLETARRAWLAGE